MKILKSMKCLKFIKFVLSLSMLGLITGWFCNAINARQEWGIILIIVLASAVCCAINGYDIKNKDSWIPSCGGCMFTAMIALMYVLTAKTDISANLSLYVSIMVFLGLVALLNLVVMILHFGYESKRRKEILESCIKVN